MLGIDSYCGSKCSSWYMQVPCGNQFEQLGREIYLAVSNKCPLDMAGHKRTVDPSAPPGITLHTSSDGGTSFKAACLPVALRVRGLGACRLHIFLATSV